jgi:AmmeMemoRadiSam system protein B
MTQGTQLRIRRPAVAGSFYPGDAEELARSVESYLDRAAPVNGDAPPKALIVPHAGYIYSGPVAASGYIVLRRFAAAVERVILIGPAHRVPVRGLAAPEADLFRTPLGDVPIDHPAIEPLLSLDCVELSDSAHAAEHSLEVQLPFLQLVLARFELVPLVAGDASAEEVAKVLERLWGGPETVVVISSDLSHYYDWESARRLDEQTSRAIEELAPERLGRESACGRVPVAGLLLQARRRGLGVRLLDLRNSGDTAGPRDQVVGYGAYAVG